MGAEGRAANNRGVVALDSLRDVVKQYWGYSALRPLQPEAMAAAVEGRDSLVVLPTGGGKSLCYQAPALLGDRFTVVVSPLIALMKDQVDRLIQRGIASAFFNSSLDADDRRRVVAGIARREYKLVFLAPERLTDSSFMALLGRVGVGAFAIDEAHCISHWGHDFRSDYRQLGQLKQRFPDTPVHGFTATATPAVRDDIIAQLGLREPVVLVGDFFRPNLRYRVDRRTTPLEDALGVIRQHRGQAGIVYCIRRDDVDGLSAQLRHAGIRAIGYHAGMSDEVRTQAQDDFSAGKADVVVATVAFGMGIDRADIRYVVHAAMPKSIEHYQQETGRAGRDGLPADCVLFYTSGDFHLWRTIIEKNDTTDAENKLRMLSEMHGFCTGVSCRHQRLVSYFGQAWERESCGACDICTGSFGYMADSTVTAQKIMSCIVRTGERYGPGYIADVLMGVPSDRIVEHRHDRLSTFGLIPDRPKGILMMWMYQLADQGLVRKEGEYRVLKVTPEGWKVLKSQAEARLADPSRRGTGKGRRRRDRATTRADARPVEVPVRAGGPGEQEPLDGSATALFDVLRSLRREIADELNAPAFMIFSDKTLREMARRRPRSPEDLLEVKGVGSFKCRQFGERFLEAIQSHLRH
jgi:ATP-dependent DNA helicase RecQ